MNVKHLFAAMAVAAGSAAAAQGAQTWTIDVADTTASPQCASDATAATCLAPSGTTNVFDTGARITLKCANAASCQTVGIFRRNGTTVGSEVPGGAPADGAERVYTLSTTSLSGATDVGVFRQMAGVPGGHTLLMAFTLAPNTAPPPPGGNQSSTRTLQQVIAATRPCTVPVGGSYLAPDLDNDGIDETNDHREGEARSEATMYVDVLGNVLEKPADSFDENDSLKVFVLGNEDLLQLMRVQRTSTIRDVAVLRTIGSETQAPGITRQSAGDRADDCAMRSFDIDSFAPGRGHVTISRAAGNTVETVGTFDLPVAPLYSGMFTLGSARTEAVDPQYKLVTNGTDQVIAPGDVSDKDTLYTIFYTPFIAGKRDLEKPFEAKRWYRHINPTFGLAVDDVSDNALLGVSIDLPRGILITAGRHYRKLDVLSPESGLTVGSVFTGAPETIPTVESWESEKFVSVTVDIRVMSQLVRNALTGGGN